MKVSLNNALMIAALSTSFIWHSAAAQIEGKLFTSPEERVYLDYLRDEFLARTQTAGFDIVEADIPDIPVETTAEQVPVEYTLGGIMTSRDGTRTVWLNGRSIAESALPKGLSIRELDGNLVLRLTAPSGNHVLRPGQTVEIYSGLIQEQYQRPRPELLLGNANNPEQAVALVPEEVTAVNEVSAASVPSENDVDTAPESPDADTIATADSLPAGLLRSGLPLIIPDPDSSDPSPQNNPEAIPQDAELIDNQIESLQDMITKLKDFRSGLDAPL